MSKPGLTYLVQPKDSLSDKVIRGILSHRANYWESVPRPACLEKILDHVYATDKQAVKILMGATKGNSEIDFKVFQCLELDFSDPRECTKDFVHPVSQPPAKVVLLRKNLQRAPAGKKR